MKKTVAEFFAGIGLMRLGLEQAGWHTVWANDIDPDKTEIYRAHFQDDPDHLVLGDVHEIDGKSIPEITLATASFPCTDLSLAGARRGLAGSGSGAFWGFVDTIRSMGTRKPPIVLLENVTGFLTSHEGRDFRDACLTLNQLGYVVDAFILDASNFVPQSRQRLFVVGYKAQTWGAKVDEPAPSFLQSPCRPAALADFILWNPDINWGLRDFKSPSKCETSLSDIVEHISPKSECWWSQSRAEYLLSQMSEKHRATAENMIRGDSVTFGTVFRRVRNGKSMAELRSDGTAGCLRTPRGGSGRQILFAAGRGNYGVRLLTARECARLMGAPDFRLCKTTSLNKALFGFGDAVCVPVVKWIGEQYLNPLLIELVAEPIKTRHKKLRYA